MKDSNPTSHTTEPRMKWVRELSREEATLDRLGWRVIAQETHLDSSVWRLWADMEDTDGR